MSNAPIAASALSCLMITKAMHTNMLLMFFLGRLNAGLIMTSLAVAAIKRSSLKELNFRRIRTMTDKVISLMLIFSSAIVLILSLLEEC